MQASRENGTLPIGGHLRGPPESQFGPLTRKGSQGGLGGLSNTPTDDPPGEIAAFFGPCCHLDPLKRGELPEKVPKKGVWALFGDFGDFPVKAVC